MSSIPRESLRRPADVRDLVNLGAREELRRVTDALGLTLTSDPVQETKTEDNVFVLSGGTHGGVTLEKPRSRLIGLADTRMERLLDIKAAATSAEVVGIHFYSADLAYLVRVSASSSVVFSGCIFEKGPNAPMSAVAADEECYVLVLSGGKAAFVGCIFQGTPAAGIVVNNLGGVDLAANVGIVGCSNRTGQSHQDVTTVFEI
jgi:hypothetical protein